MHDSSFLREQGLREPKARPASGSSHAQRISITIVLAAFLSVALCFVRPSAAQTLPEIALIDDARPQSVYIVFLYEEYPYTTITGEGGVRATVPPEIGHFTSLSGECAQYGCGYGTVVDDASGDHYLVWVDDLAGEATFDRASQPIGFPAVLGSAIVNDIIYAASFDDETGRTTILSVDHTGVGTALMELPQDVRIVALGEGGYPFASPLYGTSEPFESITTPHLYAIDPQAGTAVALMDLPGTVEGLGSGWSWDRGLLGAIGGNVFAILLPGLTTEPVAIEYWPSGPVRIVGLSSGFFPQPTLYESWGVLKDQFREGQAGDR
jgi:hypothetical protein